VTQPGTSRPGGRTARTAAAVYAAAIDELSSRDYHDISLETIAARAGVHKTTLYRRWHTKEELVTQALARAARARIQVPDTGSVEADLQGLARSVGDVLSDPRGAALTRALLAGAATSPEIRLLMDEYWAARLSAISAIVYRAIDRGELPAGTEPKPLMRALAAPLFYQLLVTGEPLTRPDADQAAAAALAAARAHVFDQPPGAAPAVPSLADQDPSARSRAMVSSSRPTSSAKRVPGSPKITDPASTASGAVSGPISSARRPRA
jgi:AcrR family transcriptional regulator